MNGGCVQNQIEQREREQDQACQGADGARTGQARAKQNEMADVAEVTAVEPEVVAIFIQDENFGWEAGSQHPFPFGHNGFGRADDADDGIAIGAKLSVEPLAGVAVGIIGDAIDFTTAGLKIIWNAAVAGEQVGLHVGVNVVKSTEKIFQELTASAF